MKNKGSLIQGQAAGGDGTVLKLESSSFLVAVMWEKSKFASGNFVRLPGKTRTKDRKPQRDTSFSLASGRTFCRQNCPELSELPQDLGKIPN